MRRVLTIVISLAVTASHAALAAAAAATPPVPAPAVAPEPIEIAQGEGVLKAVVFRPEGAGPFPAVVGMHGCAGLLDRSGTVAIRYRDWAQHLTKAGFVVLYPDSYGSRGLGSQCAVRSRAVRTDRERVADANAARRWLQNQSYVEADKVTLLGWSNGGISVLWTVRRRPALPRDDSKDFRSAVALYPGCRRLDNAAWSARIPTLILIGAVDDWTSAQDCQQMVAGARGRSAGTSIMVYPGAYHDFDHPNRPLQVRSGYAFSSDNSGRIHTGTNPAARADALKRVPQWLAR
ncbi:MAG TPA: dienelactone hydrolase family protein [Xanthobacteraceae bacterium]